MALLAAVDGWCKAADSGEYVGALLIGLSKALYSVNHHKLLADLLNIECCSNSVQWFNSYLSNRTQRVDLHGKTTEFLKVTQGVPQGSALSPLLFNIYVRSLPRSIKSDTIEFADDVTISEHDKSINAVLKRLS